MTLTPTADFVFSEDYKLNKIENVKEFISKEKHLPGIASADEMTENGVNINELQIQLLQKIEELTLYVIEMNERVKTLESENSELKEKVNSAQ